MGTMASQITSLMIVYSTVYSGTNERKHQTSTSLACVREIHRWRVNSPHKGQWRGKLFHLMTSSRKWDTLHLWANEFAIHYGISVPPTELVTKHSRHFSKILTKDTLTRGRAAGVRIQCHMMKSSNGNIFRVTGSLCGEFTGHRWIPLPKASDTQLQWFLWSVPEHTVE